MLFPPWLPEQSEHPSAARCREKLHEAHSDLQRKKEELDDLEPKVDGNSESSSLLSNSSQFASTCHTSPLHGLLSLSLSPPPVVKKIDELQASLRKKDEDMKQMEERYKRYAEKARTVGPPRRPLK